MQGVSIVLALLSLTGSALARPAPADPVPSPEVTTAASLEDRDLISDLTGAVGGVLGDAVGDINNVLSKVGVGQLAGNQAWSSISSALAQVTATKTQTNAASVIAQMSSIHAAKPSANLFEFVAAIAAEGLTANSVTDLLGFVEGLASGQNSMSNVNVQTPKDTIYPRKGLDPKYSVTESSLRSAIYIPASFQGGKVQPVILMPGSGSTGYFTYVGNYIKLLTGSGYADPVWLNIPGYLLNDAQVNAEYAAYAINYIASITGKKVSIIGWSQGNIDIQWAFKYFTSTVKSVRNHIAISPDYAGTVNANLICPDGLPCDPAVLQQQYKGTSNFIDRMRLGNGDSAYVPTTTVYSGLFDEIVEPQQGTGASAYLNDARKVGVTNNYLQGICPGLPGGSFYTHEGVLYNPIAFGLVKDALINGGAGKTSRLDLNKLCNIYLAEGLNVGDLLVTENSIVVAALSLILYLPKVVVEPAIKAYAWY
ncbi:alpha/beta-hydrolase [Aureobasidium subglaciale]|nr:alpha/beta-hydrolase [Aureobasidium subglaciale]KAI5276395.1 alpha/beta-hydrolase [Aureobasidium subglaciale]